MGRVFKRQRRKLLPENAELITKRGRQLAQWLDGKGRTQTAPLAEGGKHVLIESSVYMMRYKDSAGIVREVSTQCRTKDAAEAVLRETEQTVDKVKSGIVSKDELTARDWAGVHLNEHIQSQRKCCL